MKTPTKELLQALFTTSKSKWGNFQASVKAGPWWHRLPQLLNMAQYRLLSNQAGDVLGYDPFYLHITPAEVHPLALLSEPRTAPRSGRAASESGSETDPDASQLTFEELQLRSAHTSTPGMLGQRVGLESFRYLLDQFPTVIAIDFSGQANDPLENVELIQMVDYAFKYNRAESTIYTDGLLLDRFVDSILKSQLHHLVINMVGHRPSSYSLLSGKPLTQFMTILKNVELLIQRKQLLKSSLPVELRLVVDIHNYREIPAMIEFAENLGVDALGFENYLAPDPNQKSDRTLYSHHKQILYYLAELECGLAAKSPLNITMPKPLEADMSSYRFCKDAFHTVSVDSEFNVSACSRHLLLPEQTQLGKIWDEDYFNNPMYKWLRSIYGTHVIKDFAPDVPLACQGCPKNMPCEP